jgi:hypothetical protein
MISSQIHKLENVLFCLIIIIYEFITKGNKTCLQYGEEQLLHFEVKDVVILASTDKPKLACWHGITI